jgi:hypothetical protein
MTSDLVATLAVLAVEVALFIICLVKVRQPSNPLKPRLISYNLVMIFLSLAIFATLARIVGLITGHQITPRLGRGMR